MIKTIIYLYPKTALAPHKYRFFNFLGSICFFLSASSVPLIATDSTLKKSVECSIEKLSTTYCFFVPPQDWLLASPERLSPSVEIGFIGKSRKGFCPSLNLAIEKAHISLFEYVKIVKQLHEKDRNNRWRELGKFSTLAGEGILTEIDTKTEIGSLRLLQLILLKNGQFYVLTAGALKEEFASHYEEFEKAFRSLTITSNLISCIKNEPLRIKIEEKIESLKASWLSFPKDESSEKIFNSKEFQAKYWLPFQEFITKDFTEMGAYWQILLLKTMREEFL